MSPRSGNSCSAIKVNLDQMRMSNDMLIQCGTKEEQRTFLPCARKSLFVKHMLGMDCSVSFVVSIVLSGHSVVIIYK